jgi:putative Mg2+ transporter-C (MgtC) family protein
MTFGSPTWDFFELASRFAPRFLFAAVCGGLIGLERELKNKSAGLKTNILICVGAALFGTISEVISLDPITGNRIGDPSRIAAQIVTGIGFIGGGAIMQGGGAVIGLTTAATIWIVAAIGLCIGIGHYDMGLLCTLLVVGVLTSITFIENRLLRKSVPFRCEIVLIDPDGSVRDRIQKVLVAHELELDHFDLAVRDGLTVLMLRYAGRRQDHRDFMMTLWGTPGIREVRQP